MFFLNVQFPKENNTFDKTINIVFMLCVILKQHMCTPCVHLEINNFNIDRTFYNVYIKTKGTEVFCDVLQLSLCTLAFVWRTACVELDFHKNTLKVYGSVNSICQRESQRTPVVHCVHGAHGNANAYSYVCTTPFKQIRFRPPLNSKWILFNSKIILFNNTIDFQMGTYAFGRPTPLCRF